ncbi:MAG: hypothetical protein ACI9G1_004684, partial [Pirellulaceae bacterium]
DHNILSEGQRWMPHKQIAARSGGNALQKYLDRFGPNWVETKGEPDQADYQIRLKPLAEFRGLVEERGKFIMIPGEEISDSAAGKPVHMNATNIKELIRPLGGKTVQEAMTANLRAAQEQAQRTGRTILVHLNHPNFHFAVTAEDIAAVIPERYFEVYNGHPSVGHRGDDNHPSTERLWDIANTLRIAKLAAPPLYGVATDDSHNYHGKPGSHTGRGWVMVRSNFLTPEYLLKAMNRGDFYASSGVSLDSIQFADGQLSLNIQAKDGVTYSTEFIGTLEGYDDANSERVDKDGKPIRSSRKYSAEVGQVLAKVDGASPTYKLTGKELYVRAVVTSSEAPVDPIFKEQRQQAWTQPVGWEERVAELNKAPAADPANETIPKEAIPKEAIPKEAIPKEAIPKEAIPKEAIPKEAIPEASN